MKTICVENVGHTIIYGFMESENYDARARTVKHVTLPKIFWAAEKFIFGFESFFSKIFGFLLKDS